MAGVAGLGEGEDLQDIWTDCRGNLLPLLKNSHPPMFRTGAGSGFNQRQYTGSGDTSTGDSLSIHPFNVKCFRSSLIAHLDKPWSHVISAILNIGQEVEEDWPLFIKDHDDRSHKVVLRPGEMIW